MRGSVSEGREYIECMPEMSYAKPRTHAHLYQRRRVPTPQISPHLARRVTYSRRPRPGRSVRVCEI